MNRILKTYHYFVNDSLYRNSIYLILSTGIMAFFGFFFWIINARLFTTREVGLATTAISMVGLIASFSLLGLNSGIIRYLPKSERKSDNINTGFAIISLTTIILSIVFILGLKIFSPKLLFIRENIVFMTLFVLFTTASSLSTFVESIFIAFRDAKYVLIKNTIFSIIKLALPFLLATLGAFGIFSSWMISLSIALAISFVILIVRLNYQPKLIIDKQIVKTIGRFSFGTFIAGFIGNLPTMLLPLIITNLINPESAAYYYMATMIANLLFIIPLAVTQSLFAEGSHNVEELSLYVKKASIIISILLIPAIILVVIFGKYLLIVFGKNYSSEGYNFLQIIAISGVFIGINSIFGTIQVVQHKIRDLLAINSLGTAMILGLSYLLVPTGLQGIGLAWFLGQGLMTFTYLLATASTKQRL